jgi:hypothetical protein
MQPAPLGAPGGEVGRARTLQLPKTALFGLAECRAESARVAIGIENGIEIGIAVWRHAAVEASHERRHVNARHSARHSALCQCLGTCLPERGPSELEHGNVRVPLCVRSQRI